MIRELILCLLLNNWIYIIASSSEELKHQPQDHVIPYSEHENPPEPPTRPEYNNPGQWVGPLSDRNVPLDFIPTRLYAQVRHSDSVKRVPREEALKAASTDEERENIGRLREVVKKQKVNTYYTEEGYEDAAYDHAGHIRDADYDEKYNRNQEKKMGDTPENENQRDDYRAAKNPHDDDNNSHYEESVDSKKLDTFIPYKGFYKVWEESAINPRKFAESGLRQLETDIAEKSRNAAKGAETEVPENLKNLADSTESGESSSYEYGSSTTFSYDDDDAENSIDDSKESEIKSSSNFRIVATDIPVERIDKNYSRSSENFDISLEYKNKSSVDPHEIEEFKKDVEKVNSLVGRLIARNAMPTYSYDDLSAEWSKKIYTSTSDAEESPEVTTQVYDPTSKPEYSTSAYQLSIYKNPPSIKDSQFRNPPQVYESWKRKGIEEKYEESAPEKKQSFESASNEEYSDEKILTAPNGVDASNKLKKKYVLMVRNHVIPKNESKLQMKKTNNNLWRFNDKNYAQMQSAPLLVRKNQTIRYDNLESKQSATQESGPVGEEHQAAANTPSSIHLYRYQKQPYYRHHHGIHGDLKKRILPLIKMLPPSPISRSEYAQYYPDERRNGGNRPHHKLRPAGRKNRLIFRSDRKTRGKWQINFAKDNKKRNYKKVPLKGVNNLHYQTIDRKFSGLRQKRDTRYRRLLNDAPRIVDEVIEEELAERFPETEDEDEDEFVLSDEKIENDNKDEEKKVEVEVPEFNFSNEEKEIFNNKNIRQNPRKERTFNDKKYPFYNNNQIFRASPLKYITDPYHVPRKTSGGSEFYDSRDRYLECPEIDPDLAEVVPEEEEPQLERGPKTDLPRLRGLGDKISCLRAKYFDANPLDNPLFAERRIESPVIPEELNSEIFKSRISGLVSEPEENVHRRVSRKPEIIDIRPLESRVNEINSEEPNRSRYDQAEPPVGWTNHARRHRTRSRTTTALPFIPYQRLVYEDVMGTIKNLDTMFKERSTTSRPRIGPKRYRNVKKYPKHNRNQEKKDDIIYFTTQSPDSSEYGQSSGFYKHHPRKMKIYPYRTNKVTYRMRPMARPHRGISNKTIEYLKTVRVHKREIDPDDLKVAESRISTKRDSKLWKNFKRPATTAAPTVSDELGEDTKKLVYTLINRAKNMKPSVTDDRYGDYTTKIPSTTTISTTTKRNEETYNPVRKFDRDIQRVGYIDEVQKIKNANERYDVVEDVQEDQKSDPVTITKYEHGQKDNDKNTHVGDEDNIEVDEYTDAADDEKKTETTYKNESDEEESKEQVEKPNDYDGGHDEYENQDDDHNHNYSHESKEDHDEKPYDTDGGDNHYHDEEKNFFTESEHEKDFNRFSSRPISHHESYDDPKYSDLGPRLHKPAFHHPSFDSVGSKRANNNRNYDNDDTKHAKHEDHLFPWHEDDDDASKESKKHELQLGRHEFPWERRRRLRKLKEKIDDYHPSESLRHPSVTDHWHSHFEFDDHSFPEDSRPFSSENSRFAIKPIKVTAESIEMLMRQAQDSLERAHQPQSMEAEVKPVNEDYESGRNDENNEGRRDSAARDYEDQENQNSNSETKEYQTSEIVEKAGMDEENSENDEKIAQNVTSGTTTTPQIPATSAEYPTPISKSTTPTIPVTAQRLAYTVRPRPKRLGVTARITKKRKNLLRDQEKLESQAQTSSIPGVNTVRTVKRRGMIKKKSIKGADVNNNNGNYNPNNNDNDNNSNNNRRRFIMTSSSTTTPRSRGRKLYNGTDNKSTTPASRKVEHRSKVSKEEIITKTSFPSIERRRIGDSEQDKMDQPNETIQKVSIVTKETPEHIYQTQEINQNGKKNMYVVIIPNNNTQSSLSNESNEPNEFLNMSVIDKFGIDDIENSRIRDYNEESPVLDVSLPAADKLKLTEHGSTQVMSAVSYISKNYEF